MSLAEDGNQVLSCLQYKTPLDLMFPKPLVEQTLFSILLRNPRIQK